MRLGGDAFGRRVWRIVSGTATYCPRDPSGRPITELASTGGFNRGEIEIYPAAGGAAGRHLATGVYPANGGANNTTHFDYSDWLGRAARAAAKNAGTRATVAAYEQEFPQEILPGTPACTSLPYGADFDCSGGTDDPPMHFTGQVRDAEADPGISAANPASQAHFPARYYTSNWGGWLTPDPLGGHPGNPQTLDRYVYAADNPVSLTDPTGLDFYLTCQHTDKNAATCEQETAGHDKNGKAERTWVQGTTSQGKFTATLIGNGADGGLVDLTVAWRGPLRGCAARPARTPGGPGTPFAPAPPVRRWGRAALFAPGGPPFEISQSFAPTLAPGQTARPPRTGTGAYTGSVNGGGVQLSNNGGKTFSTGVFVNGTPVTRLQDAGWANGGALDAFTYVFTNSKLEANQTAAGTFTFAGTPQQAAAALEAAGYFRALINQEPGIGYRSPGSRFTGANSGHFILGQDATVPATGSMHFGEHNPFALPFGLLLHCTSDGAPCF